MPNSTIKCYFSISFYQTKLTLSESCCQITDVFHQMKHDDVPENNSFSLRYELILLNLY